MLPRENVLLFTIQSKSIVWLSDFPMSNVWLSSRGLEMRFVTVPHQCLWPPSGLIFSADQYLMLPRGGGGGGGAAHTASFRLPIKRWGLLTIPHLMLLKELQALCASFPGLERMNGPSFSCGMLCLPPLRPQCRCQLKHHMQLNFKPSFLQLTPFQWLDEALASLRRELGAGPSRSSLLLWWFLSSKTIREQA